MVGYAKRVCVSVAEVVNRQVAYIIINNYNNNNNRTRKQNGGYRTLRR